MKVARWVDFFVTASLVLVLTFKTFTLNEKRYFDVGSWEETLIETLYEMYTGTVNSIWQ